MKTKTKMKMAKAANKEWISGKTTILLTIFCLLSLFPLLAFAEVEGVTNDLSMEFLRRLFGNVGAGVISGVGMTVIGKMMYVFNSGVLSILSIFLSYTTGKSVVELAHADPNQMARKFNWWQPMRIVMAISLLVPQANGYSTLNVIIMWTTVQGVDLANKVWSAVVDHLLIGEGKTYERMMTNAGGLNFSELNKIDLNAVAEERNGGTTGGVYSSMSDLLRSENCMRILYQVVEESRRLQLSECNKSRGDDGSCSAAKIRNLSSVIPGFREVFDVKNHKLIYPGNIKLQNGLFSAKDDESNQINGSVYNGICGVFDWAEKTPPLPSNPPPDSKAFYDKYILDKEAALRSAVTLVKSVAMNLTEVVPFISLDSGEAKSIADALVQITSMYLSVIKDSRIIAEKDYYPKVNPSPDETMPWDSKDNDKKLAYRKELLKYGWMTGLIDMKFLFGQYKKMFGFTDEEITKFKKEGFLPSYSVPPEEARNDLFNPPICETAGMHRAGRICNKAFTNVDGFIKNYFSGVSSMGEMKYITYSHAFSDYVTLDVERQPEITLPHRAYDIARELAVDINKKIDGNSASSGTKAAESREEYILDLVGSKNLKDRFAEFANKFAANSAFATMGVVESIMKVATIGAVWIMIDPLHILIDKVFDTITDFFARKNDFNQTISLSAVYDLYSVGSSFVESAVEACATAFSRFMEIVTIFIVISSILASGQLIFGALGSVFGIGLGGLLALQGLATLVKFVLHVMIEVPMVMLTPIFFTVISVVLMNGLTLMFFVPLSIYLYFMSHILSWLMQVLESMFSMVTLVISMCDPHGQHDLFGRSDNQLIALLVLFIKPALIVITFVCTITIIDLGIDLFYISFGGFFKGVIIVQAKNSFIRGTCVIMFGVIFVQGTNFVVREVLHLVDNVIEGFGRALGLQSYQRGQNIFSTIQSGEQTAKSVVDTGQPSYRIQEATFGAAGVQGRQGEEKLGGGANLQGGGGQQGNGGNNNPPP